MTWILIAALALVLLAPLAMALYAPPETRDRAEADRALFHAQLAELAREREAGRLFASEILGVGMQSGIGYTGFEVLKLWLSNNDNNFFLYDVC